VYSVLYVMVETSYSITHTFLHTTIFALRTGEKPGALTKLFAENPETEMTRMELETER
jgi:hypothetical protein